MIYTKKGDRGQTGLFDGRRVSKNTALIEAIGAVDELNATIGAATDKLTDVQSDLFAIGATLAGLPTTDYGLQRLEKRVAEMEKDIDRMWGKMPELRNFILPRGPLHLARTVCRRAERAVVAAKAEFAYQYLNRLSDYLFCLARFNNFKAKKKETIWKRV